MPKTVFAIALAALALDVRRGGCRRHLRLTRRPARGTLWQGPYVGANLGYQWGHATNAASKPSGVAGRRASAATTGRSAQFVFGGETDLQLSDADDRFAGWKFSNPWFGTLRARAGFAMNNLSVLRNGRSRLRNLGGQEPRQRIGIADQRRLAAAGVEVALMANWTARAEYLYVDLNDRSFVLTGGNRVARIGVNYRF